MNLSNEQLKEILNLAKKYECSPNECHRKNLANSCGSDDILSMVRELIAIREQAPVAFTGSGSLAAINGGREGYIWGESSEAHPIKLYRHWEDA